MKSVEFSVIPVYLCDQTGFRKKFRSRYIIPYVNTHSPPDLEDSLSQIHYPKSIWRFNQIIGYVVVRLEKFSEDHYDIIMEKWSMKTKRTSISTRKDRLAPSSNIGDHFIVNCWDRDYLMETIKRYIENDDLYKNRYIDYSQFDIFMRVIDFDKLKVEVGTIR